MLPLENVTVVSLEQAVAAPLCTRHLADHGARVVKIERPGSGDFARGYDETVHGLSSHFVWLNRGKESVTLDLKRAEAREALSKLVARADVLVQNLAPGAAARLGLDFATLAPHNPRLVVADISGYGDTGPYRDKKAYDTLIQAEGGLMSVTGLPEAPSRCGISVADIAAGMYAYSGILTALLQRERTGRGTRVEVSMLEALVEWMGYPIYYGRYGGRPPGRTGATHPSIAPYGPHRTGDGKTVVLGLQNEREWAVFCEQVLRRADLATDRRFTSNSARVANRTELTRIIEETFAGATAADVVAR
ncbi:MAG: CaiB/BaiF CoA transferase family protein, partial [Myxococcales bacterium]